MSTLDSFLSLARDSSITLWGSTCAKKLARVLGSRPCSFFQKSVLGLTPAITKLFKVSYRGGLDTGYFQIEPLEILPKGFILLLFDIGQGVCWCGICDRSPELSNK